MWRDLLGKVRSRQSYCLNVDRHYFTAFYRDRLYRLEAGLEIHKSDRPPWQILLCCSGVVGLSSFYLVSTIAVNEME